MSGYTLPVLCGTTRSARGDRAGQPRAWGSIRDQRHRDGEHQRPGVDNAGEEAAHVCGDHGKGGRQHQDAAHAGTRWPVTCSALVTTVVAVARPITAATRCWASNTTVVGTDDGGISPRKLSRFLPEVSDRLG